MAKSGRERGGRNGGGKGNVRLQKMRTSAISASMEIVEYNVDDAQHRQSDDTLTYRGGKSGCCPPFMC
jgi:hypothetical protein